MHSLFQLKSFLILWSTQAVSTLGSSMSSYALMVWAYQQQKTASSITLLAVCSYLPSILFAMAAGTLADRWDKKKVMLASDLTAALGTLTVLLLYRSGALAVWHLYLVNALISLMNAFQNPASSVAVSLIAPKDQYTRVSGLQSFSNSLVTILTPSVATALLSFTSLETVLALDLVTFVVAFCTLLFLIPIPKPPQTSYSKQTPFYADCLMGLRFLQIHRPLWQMILFFSFVNLLASLAGDSLLPAMILARTGGDSMALGMVTSAVGIGTLAGSLLVTFLRPPRRRIRAIFLSCALSFLLCNVPWALGHTVWIWTMAAFLGNLPLPLLNANLTTIMRTSVPLEMQGRVFATRDTFQYLTIPLGLALGGLLADHIFEPFMAVSSPLQQFFSQLVGTGKGSGMAILFLLTGWIGFAASLLALKSRCLRSLDEENCS